MVRDGSGGEVYHTDYRPDARVREMVVMKLYALQLGAVDLDRRVILPASAPGARMTVPVPAYLVELVDGERLLIDTGMPLDVLEGRVDFGDRMRPVGGAGAYIGNALRALGVAPESIGLVVATHFHFDHAGGLDAFARAMIVAQRRAVEAARVGSAWEQRLVDAPGRHWRLVDGDVDLAEGVRLLETSGHTIGHQSVLIDTGRRRMLLAIDCIYTQAQYESGDWGAYVNREAAIASAEKLRDIARTEGAELIYGHDAAQWATLRHAPEYYD